MLKLSFFFEAVFYAIPSWQFPVLFFVIILWSLSALVQKGSLGRKALDPQLKSGIYDVFCAFWFGEVALQKVFLLLWVPSTKAVVTRELLFSPSTILERLAYMLLGNGGLSQALAFQVGTFPSCSSAAAPLLQEDLTQSSG